MKCAAELQIISCVISRLILYSRGSGGPLFLSFSGVLSLVGESKVVTQPSNGVDGRCLSGSGAVLIFLVGETGSGEESGPRSHGRDFLVDVFGAEGGGLAGGAATLSYGGVKPMII